MPTLTLKFKDTVVNKYKVDDKKPLLIGRRRTNDLVIENLSVSGDHAKVESSADGYVITDLQSKNGTYVNNKPVTSCVLNNGDIIKIGMHSLVFSK